MATSSPCDPTGRGESRSPPAGLWTWRPHGHPTAPVSRSPANGAGPGDVHAPPSRLADIREEQFVNQVDYAERRLDQRSAAVPAMTAASQTSHETPPPRPTPARGRAVP